MTSLGRGLASKFIPKLYSYCKVSKTDLLLAVKVSLNRNGADKVKNSKPTE